MVMIGCKDAKGAFDTHSICIFKNTTQPLSDTDIIKAVYICERVTGQLCLQAHPLDALYWHIYIS